MQGGIIAPRSLDMLAAPWLCTMLMVYLLVGKKRSCSRLLEPGGHAKECSKKCQMVSVGSWAQSKMMDAHGTSYDSMIAYSSSSLKSPCQPVKLLPALCDTPPELIPLPPD